MDEEIKKEFEKVWAKIRELEGKELILEAEVNNEDVFEKQDDKIIVTRIIGDKPKDKAKNIVLLSLLGYKQKLGELEIHTSKLRENVAVHGIPLENFGTWVNELIPQSIMKKGKKGSTKVTYKLTTFGEAKAKNLLKEVVEDDSERSS